MYCQHNPKLEERQLSVKLFCASPNALQVHNAVWQLTRCYKQRRPGTRLVVLTRAKMQEMYECQLSKHTTENFGTYQLSLTGWLTACNYMSYEMPE
jgi:hypothetical protein